MNAQPAMYRIRYSYDNPSSAGPFKGTTTSAAKYSKGDSIYAVFGMATVISCRAIPMQPTKV